MTDYIFKIYPHRIRIRGGSLATKPLSPDQMKACRDIDGVCGAREGNGSILLMVGDNSDFDQIINKLKNILPQEDKAGENPAKKRLAARKCWLRSLFTAGVTTVGLAACGWHHAHAWAGGAFALLATHHIWERRKALF